MEGVAQWAAIGLIAVGQIGAWITFALQEKRNGENRAKERGSLIEMVNDINRRLDDPDNGLGAIKKAVDGQKLHCAKISTELATKVRTLEKRVNSD